MDRVCSRQMGLSWLLVTLLVVGAGCGGTTEMPTEDKAIYGVVTRLADTSPESAEQIFLKNSIPADPAMFERYAKFQYNPVLPASVDGDKAEVQVNITDAEGKQIAQQNWKLAKQGTEWKIEEAPLP